MTRLSISLGAGAMPEVAEALEHARAYPTHDPVVFCRMDEGERSVWWLCRGDYTTGASHTEDPTNLCAKGGRP